MKTADHTSTASNLHRQKAQSPFSKKGDDQSFFSEVQKDVQPFFDIQPQRQTPFFSPLGIQAKLKIGQPGDKYEQEADAVADKVVEKLAEPTPAEQSPRTSSPASDHSSSSSQTADTPTVQEQTKEGPEGKEQETKEPEIQRKPIFESEASAEQEAIQPKLANETPTIQLQEEEELSEENVESEGQEKLPQASGDEGGEEIAENSTDQEKNNFEEEGADLEKPEDLSMQNPAEELKSEDADGPDETGDSEVGQEISEKVEEEQESKAEEEANPQEEALTEAVSGESEPSENKALESLTAGSKSEGKAESSGGGGPDNAGAALTGQSGSAGGASNSQASAAAASSSQGGEQLTEKMGDEEQEQGGLIDAIPAGKESDQFPEPDEQLPGKEPEPLNLGISKTQQNNLILSKGATEEPSNELAGKLQQSKGSGHSLDTSTAEQMGGQIGADFNGVRIHTGSEARSMNEELGSKAFTHGKDIYFNQGQFDTSSTEGKRLLAHELTHTVQQGATSKIAPKQEEETEQPQTDEQSPNIQTFGGVGGALVGLAGSAAQGLAAEGVKRLLQQLGERAVAEIMKEVLGLGNDQSQKEGDWQGQLLNFGQQIASGENIKDTLINALMAKAQEQMAVQKGGAAAEKGNAEPLPPELMALIEKMLGFATGSDGGAQGGLMGTDQAAEEEAVQAGVQEDAGGWEQIAALTDELAPMAGEQEEDVKQMAAALGQLKESNWKSLPAWMQVFEAGQGLIPGLGGMVQSGKKALNNGIAQLKEKLGDNATKFWQVGSKLANAFLSGSGSFKERALKVAKNIGLELLNKLRGEGTKQVGNAQGLEGKGNKMVDLMMSLVDGRAAKVFNTVSSAIREGGILLQGLPGRVGQAARSAYEWVKARLDQGKSKLQQIIAKVKAWVNKVIAAIKKAIKKAYEFLKRMVKKAIEAGKKLLQKAWAKIKEIARKAWEKAKALLKKVTDKIKAFLKPAIDWLKKKIIEPIKGMIKRAKEKD